MIINVQLDSNGNEWTSIGTGQTANEVFKWIQKGDTTVRIERAVIEKWAREFTKERLGELVGESQSLPHPRSTGKVFVDIGMEEEDA